MLVTFFVIVLVSAITNAAVDFETTFTRDCIIRDCPAVSEKIYCDVVNPGSSDDLGSLIDDFAKCMNKPVCGYTLNAFRPSSLTNFTTPGYFLLPSLNANCSVNAQNSLLYGFSDLSNAVFPSLFTGQSEYDVTLLFQNLILSPITVNCVIKQKEGFLSGFLENLFNGIIDFISRITGFTWRRKNSNEISTEIIHTYFNVEVNTVVTVLTDNTNSKDVELNPAISVSGGVNISANSFAQFSSDIVTIQLLDTGIRKILNSNNVWLPIVDVAAKYIDKLLRETMITCNN
ncbi:hypothetical protein CHUAL_013405 [Chamberlinius hualienensis]